ncbi:unnamed protein product [Fusarium langsethiae]|nr:unnamed protein product [Fusarium langsethiae]
MGSLYTVLLLIWPLLWTTLQLRALLRNYRSARHMRLPIVICPYDPDGPQLIDFKFVFAIISEPLRPILRLFLPVVVFRTFELTLWGWEFHDKGAAHQRLGPAFVVVTTGLNRLISADPVMAGTILARRQGFVHPDVTTNTMGLLGPNLVTSRDESWSRQRRIVAPALNERISTVVWKESAEQASSLVDALLTSPPSSSYSSGTFVSTLPGLRAIAINVLTRVAYGHRTPFCPSSSSRTPSEDLSYIDAISLCTEHLLVAAFVPSSVLNLLVMPRTLRRLGAALKRLPQLTRDMLDTERHTNSLAATTGQETATGSDCVPDTVMRTLVRLSDEAKNQPENHSSLSLQEKESEGNRIGIRKTYLTEDEIAGNLFIFTAAGFDTTSNTLGYAVTLLAAYPEWQAWIQAEIDNIIVSSQGCQGHERSLLEYTAAFPKLTRCLAFMVCFNIPEPFLLSPLSIAVRVFRGMTGLRINILILAGNPSPLPTCDYDDALDHYSAKHPVRTVFVVLPRRTSPVRCPYQYHGNTHIDLRLGAGCTRIQTYALDQSQLSRKAAGTYGAAPGRLPPLVHRAPQVPWPEDVAGGVRGCNRDDLQQMLR